MKKVFSLHHLHTIKQPSFLTQDSQMCTWFTPFGTTWYVQLVVLRYKNVTLCLHSSLLSRSVENSIHILCLKQVRGCEGKRSKTAWHRTPVPPPWPPNSEELYPAQASDRHEVIWFHLSPQLFTRTKCTFTPTAANPEATWCESGSKLRKRSPACRP